MVWLYRSPLPAGRKGLLFVFICRLPAFAAPIRGEGAVSTLADKVANKSSRFLFLNLQMKKRGREKMTCWLLLCLYYLLSAYHRDEPSQLLLSAVQVCQLAVRRPGQDGAARQQACSGMNIPPNQIKNKPKIITNVHQNLASYRTKYWMGDSLGFFKHILSHGHRENNDFCQVLNLEMKSKDLQDNRRGYVFFKLSISTYRWLGLCWSWNKEVNMERTWIQTVTLS